jgi:predicted phosphodiesterase
MRYLIISDIHANLEALETVLDAAGASRWDRVLVLGDLVGYGADPNAVIDRVRGLNPTAVIRGNHDRAASGLDDASDFNAAARAAALWTFETLTPENRTYLRELAPGPLVVDGHIEICHGSPWDEDEYMFAGDDAAMGLEETQTALCFFGHTHIAVVFSAERSGVAAMVPDGDDSVIEVGGGRRLLVNPGSVGQPRDGDPRAAFAIYDEEEREVVLRRVSYPIERAQEKILAAGLPRALAARLAVGR